MDNKNLAVEILNIVDSNNIIQATNCMTRLRLQLVNKDSSMLDKLKSLEGVLGINDTENELQII